MQINQQDLITNIRNQYYIYPGLKHPFGSTVTTDGVNFSIYSSIAEKIELLIFDKPDDLDPEFIYTLDPTLNKTNYSWHVFVKGLRPGCGYAYRVHGANDLYKGHRIDPEKVLIDPYSKGNSLKLWDRASACLPGDNLHKSMRSVVIDTENYDWEDDSPLNIPLEKTVVYEMHIGGFTKHPSSDVKNPGTFIGLIEKIPYLKKLGITAVELLPCFSFDHTDVFKEVDGHKLVNYWGYSTVGYFSPHQAYCVSPESGDHIKEFRDMVKALHKAGIEVILDVVFNHTDEGNHQGPTFSFKGIDNPTYYYLTGDNGSKEYYFDYTGCGNTFNCNHPICEKFILDCLRFWVKEMHVDGFRFDEGSILSRGENGAPLEHPPVIWSIELDEVLADSKVIAEAWDAAGLYQIGYFPGKRWAEWNGKYRDAIRGFVKGDPGLIGEVASRITGSADLYQSQDRNPVNSVNFITAHDGFTLYDLCAYNNKNNWANGENNNDGIDDNLSWNCGAEGITNDQWINDLRIRQVKNFATILMLSQGIPMFVAGDEFMRTQNGNNNTYCHDNELNWHNWDDINSKEATTMISFWSNLIRFREENIDHFKGKYYDGSTNKFGVKDIEWHGTKLYSPGWDDPNEKCLSMTLGDISTNKNQIDNLHIMFNMHWESISFEIPNYESLNWFRVLDTSIDNDILSVKNQHPRIDSDDYILNARSIVILSTNKNIRGLS